MKSVLLHANPAGIAAGLKIACVLCGAADAVLVTREELDPQQLLADAGIVDLPLQVTQAALVNKTAYKGARLLALDELAALADRLTGGKPGVLVSVDGEPAAEEDPNRPAADLIGECKGVFAGNRLYSAAGLAGRTVTEIAGVSGVIRRLTDSACPVQEALRGLRTLRARSCGKCTFCREGLYQLSCLFGDVAQGRAKPEELELAADAGETETASRPARRKRVYCAVGTEKPAQTAAPAAEAEQTKPIEVKIMKNIETDVVIVAGGPAGLAAAVTVGEQGLKSVILEKSSATGGAANMGMGPLGIDTKIQRAAFNNISVEKAIQMHMEYTHYRVDEDVVQTYFHKSADTIEWLQEMGVEFAGAFRYFKESEATWHIVKPENGVIGPRAAGAMVKVMTERARELGCEILTETPAVRLIVEDGKVCGAVAVDKNGEGIEVRGKAVLVATGGFGNNPEMIEKEFGLHIGKDYFPFRIPGITGDGLRMMWEVGAEKFGQNIEAIYQLPDNLNWFLLDAVLRQPNLMVNQLGDRFMNEGDLGNTTYAGNALALQPGNYAYCIMDESILKLYKKNGPDIVDIVHPAEAFLNFEGQARLAVEQGYEAYFEAKTIPELAEKLGIDADKLQETIDDYNAMCRCGVDSQFHKPQKYLHPITGKGKYLVGKYYLGAYGTVGGVRINKYCEVLNRDHLPIEGLYSAGSDANTLYGDSYNFTLPGNSMGFAVNSGRMAGEAIAQYIADCR